MRFDKKRFVESIVLGIAGLIAFTIVALIVYLIGIALNLHSLRLGFVSEVILIKQFILFFALVTLIKIFIGGQLIDLITRIISKILKLRIFATKNK